MKHINNKITEYFKDCPKCNKIIYYSTKRGLKISLKRNKACNACARTGRKLNADQKKLISKNTKLAMSVPEIKARFLVGNLKGMSQRVKKLKDWHLNKDNMNMWKEKMIAGLNTMPEDNKIKYMQNITNLGKQSKGKKLTSAHKSNISNSIKGEKNGFYGKHHSEKNKLKFRKNRLKQLESLGKLNYIVPQYNESACEYFDWLNAYKGWYGIHAKMVENFILKT